jgi:predicted GTPase
VLEDLIREQDLDTVVFAYSDVSHETVMHAGRAIAAGADFEIRGSETAMLDAPVPVVAVDAARTGCGNSAVSRVLADELQSRGVEPVVVREPMPYGDLVEGHVRRFETMADLDEAGVTIEDREEYEQDIERGHVVYAGVDYGDVIERASEAADVLLLDGGNNELPFVEPNLHVVLCDPLRAGAETRYYPGEANLRMADYALVNKENSADAVETEQVVENVESVNPDAEVLHADSVVSVDEPDAVAGAEGLVVEDGPTVTHGDASTGAGSVAAEQFDAAERIDPEPHAVGIVADALDEYPHPDRVLPAMGYSEGQIADLEATVENADPDLVLAGTPHDLGGVIDVDVPVVRVRYRVAPNDWSVVGLLDDHAEELGL